MNKNHIPDSKLEWYLLGALPEHEQAEIAALEQSDEELRGRIEALRASDAEILQEYPPSRLAERFKQRYQSARGTIRRQKRGWPASIVIYAALLLFLPLMTIVVLTLIAAIDADDAHHAEEETAAITMKADSARGDGTAEIADPNKIATDTLIDSRDGQSYRMVKIGDRTWMAENLNFKTGNSWTNWCYADNESYCQKYGRLYEWSLAQVICPAGWRLPAIGDWDDLIRVAGGEEAAGKKLRTTTGWSDSAGSTDEFGFSATPGGAGCYENATFGGAGSYGHWWSGTLEGTPHNWYRYVSFNGSRYVANESDYKGTLYSVRCVREE